MTVTPVTWPESAAWALAEQIDASRQPLPTPPPLAKPMVYLPPPAPPLGAADDPLLEHAAAITAIAAIPMDSRARAEPFLSIRSPPRSADTAARPCVLDCVSPPIGVEPLRSIASPPAAGGCPRHCSLGVIRDETADLGACERGPGVGEHQRATGA